MADPEDVNYKPNLTPQSLEKAQTELFEDPKQRLGAVQSLRRWVKEQPHFTSRTDTDFLLQVLRTAKFSQLRSREIIENILTMKTKLPKMMSNLDSQDPAILAFIERGVYVPLPKPNKEGRYVFLLRPGQLDLSDKRFSVENEFRTSMVMDFLRKDSNENLIVNGEYLVCDMTGYTAKHVARMALDHNKDAFKIYQDCLLGRMKGFHLYNAGGFFEIVTGIVKPFLKKKYLERNGVHSTMESLYKMLPMECWPDEYLPDDYTGPSAGPIKDICENVKQKLMDPGFRARLLEYSSDRYKIDKKTKPVDVAQASFRKLNLDD